MTGELANPFAVQTPEDIPAADVVSLFVDVFSDYHNIPNPGHTFLNGPRGSGKSMMFRYLEPDCQKLLHPDPDEIPFFGVYVPIKNTEIKLTEFNRLTNKHAEIVLNEHFLVTYLAVKFFSSLKKAQIADPEGKKAKLLRDYYRGRLAELLTWSGWAGNIEEVKDDCDASEMLNTFLGLFSRFYSNVISYLRRLAFSEGPFPYSGPLLGYLDFIVPMIRDVRSLGFMPQGPVFLLIDDADNLSLVQTRILNGWVSSRTSDVASLKISTQLTYKTYLTTTSQSISSPHDFNDVNLSAIYTSDKNKYLTRVEQIVNRRVNKYEIERSAREFFPEYKKQEDAIRKIGEEIKANFKLHGRGYRANDDVTRYARPDYMKSLQGSSKSGSTYRYAGFEQLVHISSGIIRYFLEAASLMYGDMRAKNGNGPVAMIDTSVQDRTVRELARQYLVNEFDRIEVDDEDMGGDLNMTSKLRNLIRALGEMFHAILISNAAERRVFSIALTDENDKEVMDVLALGVRYGYFHESSIGNKEGTGRVRLFVLTRRLAPFFMLDPTSFAGYKFITTAALRRAIHGPQQFVRQFVNEKLDDEIEDPQIPLFEGAER